MYIYMSCCCTSVVASLVRISKFSQLLSDKLSVSLCSMVARNLSTDIQDDSVIQTLLTDLYQITMCYGYWKAGVHEQNCVFDVFFRYTFCFSRQESRRNY